ncbi:MAG: DUF6677 family protein [Planctomycetota bacterium]
MSQEHQTTPRGRLLRLLVGAGLLALGCLIYALSRAYDAQHRGALLAIVAMVFAFHFIGQAFRRPPGGRVERVEESAEPPPAHMAFSVVLAWLVPGLGHWVLGRRAKAMLFFGVISACFFAGLFLADARNLNYERDSIWFWAYGWNGLETLGAAYLARGLALDHYVPHLAVGYLYVAVAGLLNMVAMMDVVAMWIRSEESHA